MWNEGMLILRMAGYDENKAKEILKELGFKEEKIKELEITPLVKSMFYNNAYKLALKLKEENPNWSHKRIRSKIWKKLGIWIPSMTIYYWIAGRGKPNITPLKICPELGYVVGALMSDSALSNDKIRLKVKDEDFAKEFAHALKEVTGKEYKVKAKDEYYIVDLGGSALRYIVKSGLWKVIAFLYSKEFLQGLYDGDGGACVSIDRFKPEFQAVIILANSNLEFLTFVKKILLEKFGIHCSIKLDRRRGEKIIFQNQEYTLKRSCWKLVIKRQEDLVKFYKLIGFRIQRRQRKLRDAIEILREHESNKERVEAWLKKYTKVNNRWIPKPSILSQFFNKKEKKLS